MVFRIGWRLRTEKKGLRKKDDVWRAEISGFRMHLERFSANGNIFVLRKRPVFSIHAKPPNIRKAFSQHTAATISHRTQTNVQPQISSAKPYCELAVQHPFFESPQSCVSCAATLSHRFKSSPAIPGKVAIPGVAGYMMNAGHFRGNYVSSGDLNRGRRTKSRVLFGYFLHDTKNNNSFSLAGSSEVFQTSNQCT